MLPVLPPLDLEFEGDHLGVGATGEGGTFRSMASSTAQRPHTRGVGGTQRIAATPKKIGLIVEDSHRQDGNGGKRNGEGGGGAETHPASRHFSLWTTINPMYSVERNFNTTSGSLLIKPSLTSERDSLYCHHPDNLSRFAEAKFRQKHALSRNK